jgi:hypothetical protein
MQLAAFDIRPENAAAAFAPAHALAQEVLRIDQ